MDRYEVENIREESQTLQSQLDKIRLSDEEIRQITKRKTFETLRKEGLNILGPLGIVTNTVMEWHANMEKDIKKLKEQKLLEGYFQRTEDQLNTINKLKDFVTDPYGFTLFSKIRMILNDTPPDSRLIDHLSTVLTNIIVEGQFEMMFVESKYVLNQIEKLTVQSLTIISEAKSWPSFELKASTYFGGKVSSDFHKEFGKAIASQKEITDDIIVERVIHSIRELQNANLLEAYAMEGSKVNQCECRLTNTGKEILKYLK